MTHDELVHALLSERFSTPVREWKPTHRTRPVADQLDDLRSYGTAVLDVIEAG